MSPRPADSVLDDGRPAGSGTHHEVDVARVEREGDPPARVPGDGRVPGLGPTAREVPLVQGQARTAGVDAREVVEAGVLRHEPAALPVAEVGLGGAQRGPVGRDLQAAGVGCDELAVDAGRARVAEQLLEDHLGHRVLALAEVVVAQPPVGVGDVHRRPVLVGEVAPDAVVAVHRDRVLDPELPHPLRHGRQVVLEPELGRVDADHRQPRAGVLRVPRPQVGRGAQPVDAGERPEVDQHDPPPEARGGQRRRVQPGGGPGERAERAFVGQVVAVLVGAPVQHRAERSARVGERVAVACLSHAGPPPSTAAPHSAAPHSAGPCRRPPR